MVNQLSQDARKYLYSAAAAGRIFNRPSSDVEHLQVWAAVVWLKFKGDRPRFVSKSWFKTHFVLWRRVKGKRLREAGAVRRESQHSFSVISERQNKFHSVELGDRVLFCTCGDFQKQTELFGKACCKHGYAVLQMLGHGTLQDFIAA